MSKNIKYTTYTVTSYIDDVTQKKRFGEPNSPNAGFFDFIGYHR